MSDHNADKFIESFNETVTAMHAFSAGDIGHEYLHALGQLFYGDEKNQTERDILFQDDCDHSQTEIFSALVHLQITLDDTSRLLQAFTRIFPEQALYIKRADNLVGLAMSDNDDLLDRLKEEHDQFLIDNDLPCGQSTVEYAWDMLSDYVTRTYVLDVKEPHKNIHELREQSFKLADAYQKIADLHTATAQKKLGYFHQCLLYETQPDLPVTNVEWQSLSRERQHATMTQIAEIDLSSAIQAVQESNKIMQSVADLTTRCFPKNKHQLGIKLTP